MQATQARSLTQTPQYEFDQALQQLVLRDFSQQQLGYQHTKGTYLHTEKLTKDKRSITMLCMSPDKTPNSAFLNVQQSTSFPKNENNK